MKFSDFKKIIIKYTRPKEQKFNIGQFTGDP
jgi:hypothetical protein